MDEDRVESQIAITRTRFGRYLNEDRGAGGTANVKKLQDPMVTSPKSRVFDPPTDTTLLRKWTMTCALPAAPLDCSRDLATHRC